MVISPLLSAAYGDPHPDPKYQVAGALQHICNTRPDIHYCVNKLVIVGFLEAIPCLEFQEARSYRSSSAKAEFQSLANAIMCQHQSYCTLHQSSASCKDETRRTLLVLCLGKGGGWFNSSGRCSKPLSATFFIRLRQKLGVSSPLKVAGFSTHLGDEEEREE
ncbi:hypothetical protein EPI10_022755 [Gossypium australe]|uniref:Uncharacterized protein n=1 Tax=Gossypium australe TaxID=47621 RepID=A0A5B6VSY5_9ROSI|nr:hypothetical protein EPI10_022755 [Gossypium australe]